MLIYRKSNQWTVWHFNSIIRCAFHSLAVPPIELWHEPQCKRVRIFCVAVVFLRIEIFFWTMHGNKISRKERYPEKRRKEEKKTTATIENCMHIFCETLNDIHSSPTIDKYRAFFFVCPRKHWCRSRSKAFKYFPNDRTERHTHTGFAPKCASAIVAKLKRNAVQIKSTKTQMGKKHTIYTKESESNTTE